MRDLSGQFSSGNPDGVIVIDGDALPSDPLWGELNSLRLDSCRALRERYALLIPGVGSSDKDCKRRWTMQGNEPVLEAARAIRPFLPEMKGLANPEDVDRRLVLLLRAAGEGIDVEGQVVDLLRANPSTHDWAIKFIEFGVPPGTDQVLKGGGGAGYQVPPGRAAPVRASRYECPVDGLFAWYRRTAMDEIPDCRDHPGVQLVLADLNS